MELVFLGTGAAGGTPGRGRSRRAESSLLVRAGAELLIDVTRDFARQAHQLSQPAVVLFTHGHRDASGGADALDRWLARRGARAWLGANAGTLRRVGPLGQLTPHPMRSGARRRVAGFEVTGLAVPHARDPRFPTFAWRVACDGRALVYASDVARLTPALERLSAGADLLILDGATFGCTIFSHLRIERAVPVVCGWDVRRIVLTQIGRSAPPHAQLERLVRRLCPRASPAWDGLRLRL